MVQLHMAQQTDIYLSVVLPVHNEEENIGELLREFAEVFWKNIKKPAEIIVVDDGSTDRSRAVIDTTFDEINKMAATEKETSPIILRCIALKPCGGQAAALREGFRAATGAMLCSMDSDRQYDPGDIPRFIEATAAYDMVCGVRRGRTDGFARLFCSKIANAFRNLITGDTIKDAGCIFRMMRKECYPVLTGFSDKLLGCDFFFHPLFVRSSGFRVGEISVSHRKRGGGRSNYHLVRGRLMRGVSASFKAAGIKKKLQRCGTNL